MNPSKEFLELTTTRANLKMSSPRKGNVNYWLMPSPQSHRYHCLRWFIFLVTLSIVALFIHSNNYVYPSASDKSSKSSSSPVIADADMNHIMIPSYSILPEKTYSVIGLESCECMDTISKYPVVRSCIVSIYD